MGWKLIIELGILVFGIYNTLAAQKFSVASLSRSVKPGTKYLATREELSSRLGLHGKNALTLVRSSKTVTGREKERLQQTYGGLEVVGAGISADYDPTRGYTGTVSGELFTSLEDDIPNPDSCDRSEDSVTDVAFREEGITASLVSNLRVKKNVFLKNGKGKLTYEINFFYMKDDTPSRPCYFINACDLSIVYHFNNIRYMPLQNNRLPQKRVQGDAQISDQTASDLTAKPEDCSNPARGEGGNEKVGRITYGVPPYCLNTIVIGNTCFLENDYVKVIDLQQSTNKSGRPVADFTCDQGYDDAINGAFSPVLDAMYFGTATARMFVEWFNMTPLKSKVVMFVHYGSKYENCFWYGNGLIIGDGRRRFYPFANQDVIAHEIAHGFTSQNSGLVYDKQAGGLDEAFSDITGEVAEMYSRGSNDWMVGAEIVKKPNGALRYFDDPTRDGRSLKHIRDYTDNVRMHRSSGIVNHAFYQMVHVNKMPIRQAYECFVKANVNYWGRTTNFEQGACDVMRACHDLGYDHLIVKRSFQVVGVTFADCVESSFMETLSATETLNGLIVSSSRRPVYILETPQGSTQLTVSASGQDSSIKILVYDDLESGSPLKTGVGEMVYQLSTSSESSLYLRLSADTDVDISVSMQIIYQ